jgi:hypothetical protein
MHHLGSIHRYLGNGDHTCSMAEDTAATVLFDRYDLLFLSLSVLILALL